MRPLILLHGALGAKDQFEPWLPALHDHFDIHTLNFEGHGDSPSNRPFRIEYFAENLAQYIAKHNLTGADIFGYSMGGYVALYLASVQKDLLGKIFTFASKLDWNPDTSAKEVKMLNPAKIREKVPQFAQALDVRHSAIGFESMLEKTAEMMIHLGNHPVLGQKSLEEILNLVRFGIGDSDNMVSLEETIQAFRFVPNHQLLVLPSTQHPIEKISIPHISAQILDFFNDK